MSVYTVSLVAGGSEQDSDTYPDVCCDGFITDIKTSGFAFCPDIVLSSEQNVVFIVQFHL